MARITVEDCLRNINNRFELVMVAARRARQLEMEGADPLVPWEHDKPTVVALREIAANKVNLSIFEESEFPILPSRELNFEDHPVSGETGEVV